MFVAATISEVIFLLTEPFYRPKNQSSPRKVVPIQEIKVNNLSKDVIKVIDLNPKTKKTTKFIKFKSTERPQRDTQNKTPITW